VWASVNPGKVPGCVFVLLLGIACCPPVAAQLSDDDWQPKSEFEEKFDWLQMNSGEWLKGEVLVMYDDELEFDSDEFDEQELDWDDIRQIRTSQIMNVGFIDDTTAVGILILDGDTVRVIGVDGTAREAFKWEVLSLTAGRPKEINFWMMKLFFGAIIRTGNTEVQEFNLQSTIARRTIHNRITIDFVGNENTTDGEQVANNQRLNANWDKFITKRFFVKPIYGEYFRDTFQNIDSRYTVGTGAGYQLMDTKKVGWEVSGGPGYQENRFVEVEPPNPQQESTPALLASTRADWEITSWMEFDGLYRFQLVNEDSGQYNHHLLISFETDITKLIDFDISWIWDRIEKPQPLEDGTVPQQDDFRTTVGLTFEF
jgi:putative salt-induced outer membrane protein YdiY